MATFYIQLKDKLLKIGEDITIDSIKNALGYEPAKDFNTLEGNPFYDDGNGELKIVDKDGNAIAIVDKDGIHSVEMTAKDSSNRVHKLTEKADQSDVDTKLDKSTFEEVITLDEAGEFAIKDTDGNVGLKLDSTGLHVKDVTAGKHVLSQKADLTDVTELETNLNFNNLVDNPIAVDDKGEFVIEDEDGYKAFVLNGAGATAKDFTTSDGVSLSGVDNRVNSINQEVDEVNSEIDEINKTIEGLNTDVSGTGSAHGVSVGIKQENGKITKVSVNDSNINFNNLVDNPITIENVETGEEEFVIEDNLGNRGFILNKSGVKAKDFIISESVSLSNVDSRLENIESLLDEDGDDIINNLKDVIDYFNEVKETETGAALISDVASNKSKIDNITSTVSANTTAITNLSGVVSSNTTTITTNTSSIETLTSKVNKNTSDISSLKEIINTDEDGALYIVDKDNYIGLKLDETGLFVKDVTAKDENDKEHKLTEKADITYVDGKLNYKLNAEDFNNVIKVEGSTYSTITINEDGITSSGDVTATVSDVTHILSEKADKTYVDELDKKIPSVSSIDNEEIDTIFDDIFK